MDNLNYNNAKKRLIEFQDAAQKIKTEYRKELINKRSTVLFENKTQNENKYFGRDEYFNSVIVKSDINLIGEIKRVKILEVNQNTLFGEIVSTIDNKSYAA